LMAEMKRCAIECSSRGPWFGRMCVRDRCNDNI
jgi:hypothetical protein